ncbi:hypothetical protein Lnau_2141 [Legionella nautarum]|uniref:Uncharacterized protein n=1 Tax=Legionella nautarum TaxID=45070 RepID=A0A0W0WNE7_9GAMM|nr:hypothetical protein [Legionella nautarum]KTD33849.1 hypothetical protein Lnau_2141 [Legionella nautarum]
MIIDNGGDEKVSFLIDEISPKDLSYNLFDNGFFRVHTGYRSYGKIYYITLHANTRLGGNSEPITIPIEITKNPELAPSFIRTNLVIPIYSGQSLIHDFVANQDIVPVYEQIHYSVPFANATHPSWMKIENNKLMIDEVPKNCDSLYTINLTLTNEPGGSRQTELSLMCSK